jgi:hypothetical protein
LMSSKGRNRAEVALWTGFIEEWLVTLTPWLSGPDEKKTDTVIARRDYGNQRIAEI